MGERQPWRFHVAKPTMQTTLHPGPDWALPSFPPVDAAIARARSVDWAGLAQRLAIAALFTAAVAIRLARMAAPYIAAGLRSLASSLAQPAKVPAPIACTLAELTVAELRTLARLNLGPAVKIGGRRIAQARQADLINALGV